MKYLLATAFVMAASVSQAATLITSSSDTALTGATVEDLNSTVNGSFTSATVGDLTFTALTGSLSFAPFGFGGPFGSDGQVMSTDSLLGSFRIDFANAITAVGMIFDAANSIWDVTAYDSSDMAVGSVEFPSGPPFESQFFGLSSTTAFNYVVIEDRSGFDWVLVDNISYVVGGPVAPIPVPASLPLLAVGLGGLGLMARKKRRSI